MAKIDWKDAEGTATGVERMETRGGPVYTVLFNYEVDGHWCSGSFTTNEEYRVGDSVAVRYDPKNPDSNDLDQQESRAGLVVLGVLFIVAVAVLWAVWH